MIRLDFINNIGGHYEVLRLVIGIASVIAFYNFLKSCGQAPSDTAQQVSGIGVIMAALILPPAIAEQRKQITSIADIIYLVAAVVVFLKIGMVADMIVWAIASVVAGVFFLVSGILERPGLR